MAAAVLLLPAAADAGPPAVRPGTTLLGVSGPSPERFDALTGKHHALHLLFGRLETGVTDLVTAEHAAGRIPMLAFGMDHTPAGVAAGAEDARFVALAQAVNAARDAVWVRPFAEMTGYWSAWCAFDVSGRSRGPAYSTRAFVRAFRRVAVIMRGGSAAAVDGRLRRAGLPRLRVRTDVRPSGRVSVVWNPQGHGVPDIAANGPAAYWPGGAYVDVVADDMFSDSGEPSWRGMDTLYAYGKPFLVGDWGLEGEDDVVFATRMFDWVARHPRTIGLVYFDKGWSGGTGIYELRTKPRSLALYRRAVTASRFVTALP